MSQIFHVFFCLWFCAAAAFSPAFASADEYDTVWGRVRSKQVHVRPDDVPPLPLDTLIKRSVDSARTMRLLDNVRACKGVLEDLNWQDPNALEILKPLYEHVARMVGETRELKRYQSLYKRLATQTLLRLLSEPHVTFPITLNAMERTESCCASQAYQLAEATGSFELRAQARTMLVAKTHARDVILRERIVSKGTLLMEAYALFPSHKKPAKAKALLSLLKDWPREPLHLEGHLFTRQDCVEALYSLTQGRHFPLDLKARIYRDLGKHWGQTRGFCVAGRVIDRNVLRKKGYALAHKLEARRPVRLPDTPLSQDITPRLPSPGIGSVPSPEPAALPIPSFRAKAMELPPASGGRTQQHQGHNSESF
ncbi:MAG: hypothetical protein C0514_01010 [Candidatus Puniceispirillum sp.]|nr:hypothetical protein [Candidatus Puniceispirillum sp.]